MAGRKHKRGREGWTGYHPLRPDFEPGNDLAVTHGAYSEKIVAPAAAAVQAELQASGPQYLSEPMFGPILRLTSRAVAKSELISDHLESMPLEKQLMPPKPGTAAPVETDRKASAHAMLALSKLGLTPDTAARMARQMTGSEADIARAIADMMAEDEAEASGEA